MQITKKEIFIIILLSIIAIVRFLFFIPKAPDYKNIIGKSVVVSGIVYTAPDVRLNNQRLNIKLKDKVVNLLIVTSKVNEVSYGDSIEVRGVLESPENFITSVGKEFNYNRYLANQDIYYIIKNADIKILSHHNGSLVKEYLFSLGDKFMKNITQVIPKPESDLANGLVLGSRGGFDNTMRNEFISTGTIHMIALSGYNVTIVAEGVMKIFGLIFSLSVSIVSGFIVILLFIIMTGTSATAVRAGIMATIALFARMNGRNYEAIRALIIALILMLVYDLRVITDISFELSFLATAGVLFVAPLLMKYFSFIPMRFSLREMVATTLGATISVLPLILYTTGVLSLVSLPANILILPLIPLTMLLVFLTGILGFASYFISLPFAYISNILLQYILYVIHFFSSLSFASVSFQSFPLLLVILLYIFIIYFVVKNNKL